MNATFRFMLTGAIAVGGALTGIVGEHAGVRAAMWVGGCCLALAWLPVVFSPIRTRRALPAPSSPLRVPS
jgi:predicted MFS family arabinose efflux permease